MPIYSERDGVSILDGATDPEGDPLNVVAINGDTNLIDTPVSLSVGGMITVAADGAVTFDDSGFTWPGEGSGIFDSVIATVSDGTNNVDVAVNIQLNHV